MFENLCTMLCALYFYYRYDPFNLLLLGAFRVAMSFAVGLTCVSTKGKYFCHILILITMLNHICYFTIP